MELTITVHVFYLPGNASTLCPDLGFFTAKAQVSTGKQTSVVMLVKVVVDGTGAV